jgi:hypothetical protein
MALDTADKRASALGVAVATLALVLPTPDGLALSQGDRQHVTFSYRGIAAALVSARVGEINLIGRYLPSLSFVGRYFSSISLIGNQE